MNKIEEKKNRGFLMQVELTADNESNLHRYQGGYMLQEGKRISKSQIINQALNEFFKYHLEEKNK